MGSLIGKPKGIIPVIIKGTPFLPKISQGKFPVFIRRRGKFRVAGFGRTRKKALVLGQRIAKQTLARSFIVPGSKALKLPGFRTKIGKQGRKIFIQKTGKGFTSILGSRGEKAEIKFFRSLNPTKKKRKRK